MRPAVAQLLHNPLLWRGDAKARVERAVATGFAELDRELPGGGWPQGSLTELLIDGEGIGELRLLLPALARLAHSGRWIALVAPPHLPYAPALSRAGIDPGRAMVIDAGEEKDRWWAAEQVLRSDSVGGLLFWPQSVNDARLRRLAVATQETAAIAFLFAGCERAASASPAPLRMRLSPVGRELRLDVFKRRGGVCSKPVSIDFGAAPPARVVEGASLPPKPPLTAVRRAAGPRNLSPSFNRHYPVGMPSARIWNRALVRADEGRRVPGPDPRGTSRE
ncbi:MAG TPA: translesion DNA synthesis-associated protein ImuA [Casimicrobiaceae bacterium]|nr:translesion DNA synthesis-associated protein ImuA [Casimicrobiaceae bacterium]